MGTRGVVAHAAGVWTEELALAPWDTQFVECLHAVVPSAHHDLLTPDVQLVSLGVDSIGSVQLLMIIEDSFGVTFPDEYLDAATLATPGAIWRALASLRAVA